MSNKTYSDQQIWVSYINIMKKGVGTLIDKVRKQDIKIMIVASSGYNLSNVQLANIIAGTTQILANLRDFIPTLAENKGKIKCDKSQTRNKILYTLPAFVLFQL